MRGRPRPGRLLPGGAALALCLRTWLVARPDCCGLLALQPLGTTLLNRLLAISPKETRMQFFSRRNTLVALGLAPLSPGILAAGTSTAKAQTPGRSVKTPSGLEIIDTVEGTGASPRTGQTCVMHYTGWLYQNGVKGRKFDSSVDRGQPFEFAIGTRGVIAGWAQGDATMKVG